MGNTIRAYYGSHDDPRALAILVKKTDQRGSLGEPLSRRGQSLAGGGGEAGGEKPGPEAKRPGHSDGGRPA